MNITSTLLALALVGPVTSTEDAAVGMLDTGKLAYVSQVDCRIGVGFIMLSDVDGKHLRKGPFFVLDADDPVARIAAALCKDFLS